MSFTNGKQQIATEEDCNSDWAGGKNGLYFRCYLCGHKFVVGDKYRWVFTNGVNACSGNPIVCEKCDGTNEEVYAKWNQMNKEVEEKYWAFVRR